MLDAYPRARVLVVDDNEPSAQLVHTLLVRAGLAEVDALTDPRRVFERIDAFRPDLLVLDLHMPHVDGYAVLADLRRGVSAADLPVLVLTADTTREAARRALSLGANDFVTKPLDLTEVTLRVRNLLETRTLHLDLRRRQQWIEASAALARDLLRAPVGDAPELVAAGAGAVAGADVAVVVAPGDQLPAGLDRLVGDGPCRLDDARQVGITGPGRHGGDLGPALLVPMVGTQRAHGILLLGRRRGRAPYDAAELEMAAGYAAQAALALELAAARADAERMTVLEDRHRIARDLHDHVIQRLFATGLRLQNIAAAVAPGDTADRIGERVADLDDTILQIRSSIFQLRTAEAADEPVGQSRTVRAGRPPESVRRRVTEVAAEAASRLGVPPSVRFTGPIDSAVPADVADDLVAAARSVLIDVARRTPNAAVDLQVSVADGRLLLAIGPGPDGPGPREAPQVRWSRSLARAE